MNDPTAKGPSWFNTGIHVSLAVPYRQWREAPWLDVVMTDGDEPGRGQAFRLTEQPHIELLEAAVEQWLRTETIPSLPHPASYLLALRFSTVGHLLMSFEGLFPPPVESAVPTIYRKFLLDWWREQGKVYGVGYSCSEYDIKG